MENGRSHTNLCREFIDNVGTIQSIYDKVDHNQAENDDRSSRYPSRIESLSQT
jgi:hypothetical protein